METSLSLLLGNCSPLWLQTVKAGSVVCGYGGTHQVFSVGLELYFLSSFPPTIPLLSLPLFFFTEICIFGQYGPCSHKKNHITQRDFLLTFSVWSKLASYQTSCTISEPSYSAFSVPRPPLHCPLTTTSTATAHSLSPGNC